MWPRRGRTSPGICRDGGHTARSCFVWPRDIAMTRQLAMEGREHGIRANSISPGLIETNQTLASDESSYVTGVDIVYLRRQGLVRHIGLSSVTPEQLATGRRICQIVCAQNKYNLAYRVDDALVDVLAQDGIAY